MSIKTLRKRIALVAVSALGAGLLSVAPAFADSASASSGDVIISAGSVCVAVDGNGAIDTAPYDSDDMTSLTVPLGGVLTLDIADNDYVEFRGGTVIPTNLDKDGDTDSVASTLNALGRVVLDNNASGDDEAVQLTAITAGATTLVVGATDTPTATSVTKMTITVVAACTTSTVSPADVIAELGTATDTTPDRGEDVARFSAGASAYISLTADNAYGVEVPADTWVATATNGALVNIDGTDTNITGLDDKGTTNFDTASSDGDGVFVRVNSATPATASSTVVTISYRGQVVATKTINWNGEAKTINIVAQTIGKTSGGGAIWYTLSDAAGNLVAGGVSGDPTTYGAQITNINDDQSAVVVAGAPAGTINGINNSTLLPSTAYGIAEFSCGATSGSASVTLEHENAVSGDVITKSVTAVCAGGLDTYTVSMDKASYNVGDIATLTITAKDSKGNPVNDYVNTNGGTFGAGSAADISVGGGSLTKAAANSDTFGTLAGLPAGTKTYKIQLTTAGTFNTVVNLGGATTKSATVSYSVGSGAVSNAEVLAAIVKLIASINKQIKALQKSLRR